MNIPVRCSGCDKTSWAAMNLAGNIVLCPKCGGDMTVPQLAESKVLRCPCGEVIQLFPSDADSMILCPSCNSRCQPIGLGAFLDKNCPNYADPKEASGPSLLEKKIKKSKREIVTRREEKDSRRIAQQEEREARSRLRAEEKRKRKQECVQDCDDEHETDAITVFPWRPEGAPGSQSAQERDSDFGLEDFVSFRRMLAPALLSVLWILATLGCIIAGIKMISESSEEPLGYGVLVLGPLAIRVIFEVVILPFRMNETLTDVKNVLDKMEREDKGDP